MFQNTIYKFSFCALIGLSSFCISLSSAFCAAKILAPKLILGLSSGGRVTVTLRLPSKSLKTAEYIMIQRRLPSDNAFEYFAEYHGLRISQVLTDEPEDIGTIYYRARLITSKGESQWSKSKKITIDPLTASKGNGTSNSEVIDTSTPALTPLGKGQTLCPRNQANQVIALVNDYRTNAGLEALKVHPQLQWAARTQCISMASSKTFSNEGWNEYITLSGFEIGAASVNIAKKHRTALEVMNSWMSSDNGYRSNILSDAFKYIGAACIIDKAGISRWVIDFGTPYQCPFLF